MRVLNAVCLTGLIWVSGCQSEQGTSLPAGSANDGTQSGSEQDCAANALCRAWLDSHNSLRAEFNSGGVPDDGTDGNYPLPTTALPALQWNAKLAQVAQQHANKCQFQHNDNAQADYVALGGENIYVGENIAAHWFYTADGSMADYAQKQVQLWWDEHSVWHYQAINSSNITATGHFTQMIWANTVEVGCAMAHCPQLNGLSNDAYFGVCNYGPGGNYLGQFPYQ